MCLLIVAAASECALDGTLGDETLVLMVELQIGIEQPSRMPKFAPTKFACCSISGSQSRFLYYCSDCFTTAVIPL